MSMMIMPRVDSSIVSKNQKAMKMDSLAPITRILLQEAMMRVVIIANNMQIAVIL